MRIPTLVVVCVAAGSLTGGCAKPQANETKTVTPVKTQPVAAASMPTSVRYSASIEPYDQVPLAFKASGYVDDLLQQAGADGRRRAAQPGDRVNRGMTLARVRETDYREKVTQGRARLAETEASLTKARLDLDRARTLFASDSLTKPDLDSAQASFDTAEARVATAKSDVELALSALRDCELISPANGIVLERRIEVGTLASAGTVGFVIGDLSSVKARFGIPDGMVQSVRPGAVIGVTVEALGTTTFNGRVTAVAPAADRQSRVFDVEVTIPNADGRLRPGMIGTVALEPSDAGSPLAGPSSLVVPLTAVVRADASGGQFAVAVIERQGEIDVARLRRVKLGAVDGNGIAVVDGLAHGEQVVVEGATLLTDGEPVRVIAAAAP